VISKDSPRALVVDDDLSWQQILTELLTDAGLMVDIAASADEAMISLRANAHRLAVIDLSLVSSDHHNQDGLQVLAALRRHDPACQAVLLTGFATVELAVTALTEYGATTCLRKETFRREQFRRLIDQTIASALPFSAASPTGEHDPAEADVGEKLVTGLTDPGAEQRAKKGPALVVDDDAGWRSILSELLAEAGYEVQLCTSYGEGLGRLRREKYHLAIIDLSLDGPYATRAPTWEGKAGQGLEGYRLLASTRAGRIPTIVVSGIGTPANVERAYAEYGIFAYLHKQSFNRQIFLQTVEEAVEAGHGSSELDVLTEREREVLDLLAKGMTNKEIAEALVISANTVKRHLKAIFEKLEIHTRSAAAAKAAGGGLVGGYEE